MMMRATLTILNNASSLDELHPSKQWNKQEENKDDEENKESRAVGPDLDKAWPVALLMEFHQEVSSLLSWITLDQGIFPKICKILTTHSGLRGRAWELLPAIIPWGQKLIMDSCHLHTTVRRSTTQYSLDGAPYIQAASVEVLSL